MEIINKYNDLIENKGISLSLINSGSDEFALYFNDAINSLELLENEKAIIFGGDVLIEEDGELMYAYQQWGGEYIYLNWYFECKDISRCYLESYNYAKERLNEIKRISDQFRSTCLIVFVVDFN
ncbi:hypothetical protein [Acinetobacter seifertii]|uniref:hypothetical protein n=1 Tax=Acinetobacter seifertii TaxID=1530123 RepID=UPI0024DE304B|nr:hypothetical protein [Acinetobacter seifertii]